MAEQAPSSFSPTIPFIKVFICWASETGRWPKKPGHLGPQLSTELDEGTSVRRSQGSMTQLKLANTCDPGQHDRVGTGLKPEYTKYLGPP